MECPKCRLMSPDTAARCYCGYEFSSVEDTDEPVGKPVSPDETGRLDECRAALESLRRSLPRVWIGYFLALGFFITRAIHFWVLGFAVGMVQGGSQALSRSLYGRMTPKAKSAEFFGFYDVSAKFAGIVGPALFGFIGQAMGSNRYAILGLIPLFVVGGGLLLLVNEKEGIAVAHAEDVAAGLAVLSGAGGEYLIKNTPRSNAHDVYATNRFLQNILGKYG